MSMAGRTEEAAAEEGPAPPRPRLTYALICVLALIFLGESLVPFGRNDAFLDPSVQTLIGWGGTSHALVVEKGEWFRLLTAAFLHGGPAHLAMNSLALFIAGATLEPFIGRLWFAALFVLGAVCGSLASALWNGPDIVGVGASGAIMGLFGSFLTLSLRFPKGEVRRAFVINSLGTLIPSMLPALLPAITGGSGFAIDYAAHGGGALAGAAVGLAFALFWPLEARWPPFRALALAVSIAGAMGLVWGVQALMQRAPELSFQASLIPDEDQPKTDAAAKARGEDLARRFPNDPRGHYYRALALADRKDAAGAEASARLAVERAERYPEVFLPRFKARVRTFHALALADLARMDEARAVAAPVCAADTDIAGALRTRNLCR